MFPRFSIFSKFFSDKLGEKCIRNILSKQPLFSSIEENFKFFNDEKILDLFLFIDENISKDIIDFFTAQNVIMDWHSMGLNKIRLVTHLDYTDSAHKNFLGILDKCVI